VPAATNLKQVPPLKKYTLKYVPNAIPFSQASKSLWIQLEEWSVLEENTQSLMSRLPETHRRQEDINPQPPENHDPSPPFRSALLTPAFSFSSKGNEAFLPSTGMMGRFIDHEICDYIL
jgi:hypothetical protein